MDNHKNTVADAAQSRGAFLFAENNTEQLSIVKGVDIYCNYTAD
jgi:hypothetical protein